MFYLAESCLSSRSRFWSSTSWKIFNEKEFVSIQQQVLQQQRAFDETPIFIHSFVNNFFWRNFGTKRKLLLTTYNLSTTTTKNLQASPSPKAWK